MKVPEGWTKDSASLKREFKFADFKQALDFINQVGEAAEKLNHHPDWSNSYNKVSIALTTHSAGGLTDKDYQLAETINLIATHL